MASPHASSFICLPFSSQDEVKHAYSVYYGVCLGSAAIGAPGALLFLFQMLCGEARKRISKSQRNILINLAIADLLADLGVIVRSLFYLFYWEKTSFINETNFRKNLVPAISGALVESWVYFWYLGSYFWTFFFAVDIYTSKHNGKWRLWCSHTVTWIYCVMLAAGSLVALWICTPFLGCAVDKYCIVGHFLCTFGPIFIFMIGIPAFYLSTFQKMQKTFKEGLVIEVRKREKDQAKKKILIFIIVFYFCWSVNVIDGLLMIVAHLKSPSHSFYKILYKPYYIYTVWIIEALTNPLQGLLNALAYGNTFQGMMRCFSAIKKKLEDTGSKYSSWSGEYIDVDFREGRGSIKQNQRNKL